MIEKKTLKTEVACGKFPLQARKMVECGSLVLSSVVLLPNKRLKTAAFQWLFFKPIRTYIRYPSKIPKNIKHDVRKPRKREHRAQGWAKVIPRAPKVSKKEAKGNQKAAKGSQKGTKGEPRGNQNETKDDQNVSKNRPSKNVAKSIDSQILFGQFWEPFPIKNQ